MDEGYNPAYGARPLRRAIMRLLEDSMAERMLAGDIKARAFAGRTCVSCSLLSILESSLKRCPTAFRVKIRSKQGVTSHRQH